MSMPRKRPFEDPQKYYTYLWCLGDRAIYVGYGKNNRGRPKGCGGRKTDLTAFLKLNAHKLKIFIFEAASRKEAQEDERRLLRIIRTPFNIAPGCGGFSGLHTPAGIERIRRAHKGKKMSKEFCAAVAERMRGNKLRLNSVVSGATRIKLSIAGKGRAPSLLTRQKARERMILRNRTNPPRKGKVCSLEHRKKLSIARRTKCTV